MRTVLVVEDERKIRELLRAYLEHDGLRVLTAGTGADGLQLARTAHPDLVLLDLMLPDIPGEEIAHELRAATAGPAIVMLTAKADTADRVHGLEIGADDYISKPFSPREVVLRVRAVLRRTGPATDGVSSFDGGRLVLDPARRRVTVDGQPVELTATEWGLLTTLTAVPGRVYDRAELINRVRGYEFGGYQRTIDTHVKNLRRKLEHDGHQVIETVIGAGYRCAARPDR